MSPPFPRTHGQAMVLAFIGIILLSPDALLVKWVSVDPWGVVFYRGLFLFPALLILLLVRRGRATPAVVRSVGWAGLVGGALYGITTIFFVLSIRLTTAANTLVILSAMPMIAVLMRRLFLHQGTPTRTWGRGCNSAGSSWLSKWCRSWGRR